MGNFGVTLQQRVSPSSARYQQLTDSIMQSLRVALPAIVTSFAPGPPATVEVLIATNEYVRMNTSSESLDLKTQAMTLPLLTDVPILIPGGGGYSLTFPIRAGDECLVVFADTPLDFWLQNGGTDNNPISQRRHSLSDGIAIFNLRSTPRAIEDYSTEKVQLRSDDGATMIELASEGITVTGSSVTVNAEKVTIAGSTSVTISSNTTIDGRVFLAHEHHGVTAGIGITGPVV